MMKINVIFVHNLAFLSLSIIFLSLHGLSMLVEAPDVCSNFICNEIKKHCWCILYLLSYICIFVKTCSVLGNNKNNKTYMVIIHVMYTGWSVTTGSTECRRGDKFSLEEIHNSPNYVCSSRVYPPLKLIYYPTILLCILKIHCKEFGKYFRIKAF